MKDLKSLVEFWESKGFKLLELQETYIVFLAPARKGEKE